MRYLLDTNVLREIGRTKPHDNVAKWLASVDDADLAISVLTVREVTKGIAKLHRSKPDVAAAIAERIATVFAAFDWRILAIDRAVAEDWGKMLAASEKHADDAALAATARVYRLVLVTRNTRDLLTRNVKLLNPFKSPPERIP